jgi:hypothetical protein
MCFHLTSVYTMYMPCIYQVYHMNIFVYTNDNWHILVYTFVFRVSWHSSPSCAALWDTQGWDTDQGNRYRKLPRFTTKYRAYNFVTELEIRTIRDLSRPYNQGRYGRCAGMARRPLTVWLVPCSNNSVPIWTALFSPVGTCMNWYICMYIVHTCV